MAVKRDQVSTLQQAKDYFAGSYNAAMAGVCPGTGGIYSQYVAQYDALIRSGGAFNKQNFLDELLHADALCQGDPNYKKGGSSAATVNPSTGGAAPPDSGDGVVLPTGPNSGGGSGALVWVLLGVGAYLLLS